MDTPQQSATPATAQPQRNTQLKDDIKAAIDASQEAARESQLTGQGNQPVVVRNGVPVAPPAPPAIGSTAPSSGPFGPDGFPPQIVDISIAFFIMCGVMVIGWPIARAFGKRLERRADTAPAIHPGMAEQLQRIEQAVDAMSIEVERISESQRFIARLQAQTPEKALPVDSR